jgi:hypothetical protein
MTKEQLKQEWQAKIARYEASGKKQAVWCRENGVNLRNFNRWYNNLKNQASATTSIQGWVPLQITEEAQHSLITLKIGKASIEVNEGFNASLLAEVVKVLGGIC